LDDLMRSLGIKQENIVKKSWMWFLVGGRLAAGSPAMTVSAAPAACQLAFTTQPFFK
jgi:hypothetical protein